MDVTQVTKCVTKKEKGDIVLAIIIVLYALYITNKTSALVLKVEVSFR